MVRCTARCTLLIAGLLFTIQSARALDNPSPPTQLGTDGSVNIRKDGVWPPDCTRDIPLDGWLLVDQAALTGSGPLQVSLQVAGSDAQLATALDTERSSDQRSVFRSAEPLLPNTEYKLQVQRLDDTGQPSGDSGQPSGDTLLSHFTTGDSLSQPLAFSGRPAARILSQEGAPDQALLRVALSAGISGGLTHHALTVTASSEDGAAAGTVQATPGQPVVLELPVALAEQPQLHCLTLAASQEVAGSVVLDSEFCVELPGRAEAAPTSADATEQAEDHEANADANSEKFTVAQSSLVQGEGQSLPEAQGCSVGPRRASDLSWLLLALLPLFARRRSAVRT